MDNEEQLIAMYANDLEKKINRAITKAVEKEREKLNKKLTELGVVFDEEIKLAY